MEHTCMRHTEGFASHGLKYKQRISEIAKNKPTSRRFVHSFCMVKARELRGACNSRMGQPVHARLLLVW